MKTIGIGMIGTGFMGKCHSLGYRAVAGAFRLPHEPVLQLMAEATPVLAQCAARDLGFARSTGDWCDLMIDPTVDVVDICTPPASHAEMALAAIAAGKHV